MLAVDLAPRKPLDPLLVEIDALMYALMYAAKAARRSSVS